MIKIEHLKKEYPDVTPLKDVNAVIHDGDVISVIGPSGTAKVRCCAASTSWRSQRPERCGWTVWKSQAPNAI